MASPIENLDVLENAESQLQKIFIKLQQSELAVAAEFRPNNITIVYDLEALTATFTASNVPIEVNVSGTGEVSIICAPYPSLE
jgi:hypothetical protein